MKFIKLFENFSVEGDIISIVSTPDNFHNWSNTNKLGYNDFIRQIRSAIESIDKIPDKKHLTKPSLNDFLSKIDAFKDKSIRDKVINIIIKNHNPEAIEEPKLEPKVIKKETPIFKEEPKVEEPEVVEFHKKVFENEIVYHYKRIIISNPLTFKKFFRLDELYLPKNRYTRIKKNYTIFDNETKFNTYNGKYGINFYYFCEQPSKGSPNVLFVVIPYNIELALIPSMKYNSILLPNTKRHNIYAMTEDTPNLSYIEGLIEEYDLERILLPKRVKKNRFVSAMNKFFNIDDDEMDLRQSLHGDN